MYSGRRYWTARGAILFALSCGFAPGVLSGQSVARVDTLRQLIARLPQGFSRVADLKELGNGSLIIIDSQESNVYGVDAALGVARLISRKGEGPGEYQSPLRLLVLRGDTTAVVEASGNRMLLLDPLGRPVGVADARGLLASDPPPRISAQGARATDGARRFYTQGLAQKIGPAGLPVRADSAPIERWSSNGARRDTLVMLLNEDSATVIGVSGMVIRRAGLKPFRTERQWAVAPDGRVAIVSPDPFSVTIVQPNRSTVRGPRITYDRITVTEAMKRDWMEEAEYLYNRPSAGAKVISRGGTSVTSANVSRPPPRPPSAWPAYVPPFLIDALRFDPAGQLWVQRTAAPGALPYYDLFDARGQLTRRVLLPTRSRVVGFGANVVYVVRQDSMGEEFLEKYSLRP